MAHSFDRHLTATAVLAILGTGAGLAAIAIASPWLGLGAGTDFWLYKAAAISRYDLLQIALLTTTLGLWATIRWFPEGPLPVRFSVRLGVVIEHAARNLNTSLSSSRTFVVSLVLVAAAANLLLLSAGSRPILFPDSSVYLQPGPAQSVGYPLLLSGLRGTTGSLEWLVPIQLNLLFLSLGVLGWSVREVTGSPLAGFLLAAALVLDRYVTDYAYFMLTECLFTTFVILHVAFSLRLLDVFSWRYGVLSFIALAAATLVRPAGYSMFLAIALLAFLQRPHWRAISTLGSLIIAASILGASLVKFSQTGDLAPQSFGGINLVGQVSSLIRSNTPFPDSGLVVQLDRDLQPFRDRIERATYPKEYWIVTAELYNPMLTVVTAALEQRIQSSGISAGTATNDLALHLALATIRHDPWGYARHVVAHFYGMWWSTLDFPGFIASLMPAWRQQTVERLQRMHNPLLDVAAYRNEPPAAAPLARAVLDGWWGIVIGTRILVLAAAFAAALYGLRLLAHDSKQSSTAKGLTYLAIQTHVYFLFIAAVEAGSIRYAIPFEPLLITMVTLMLVHHWDRAAGR